MDRMTGRRRKQEADFEENLAALEAIVDELERGELPLELAIARYEEGMKLYQRSAARLRDVRRRVEKLLADGEREEMPDVAEPEA